MCSEGSKTVTDIEADEAGLAELAQKGNKAAVEAVLSKYTPLVYAACRNKYLPGADFEDLMQEGLIGILNAIRDFKSDQNTSFSSFAEMCVKRRIASALKTANRQKHSPLNSYVSFQAHTGDEENGTYEEEIADVSASAEQISPEEILIRQESDSILNEQLRTLLSPQELSVLFGILDGYSYSEIASSMGISEKSVDNARQRIKTKLIKKSFFD